MIRFNNDYGEGCHPRILQLLGETNMEQSPGYGKDAYCQKAEQLIRQACAAPGAAVHFVAGGTMANLLAITAALLPYQAAVAPASGHISVHETGAIEAAGHKVLELPAKQGKLSAAQVAETAEAYYSSPLQEHAVMPKLVYLSQPTELGTLYTQEELLAISRVCRQYNMYLYVDGARLGYALEADQTQVTLPFLAECCDCFTIGGTKLGALFGEAIVIQNADIARCFRHHQKQRGGILAKGRLLGLQFTALFEGSLYRDGARHALRLAKVLASAFEARGIPLAAPAETNQLFPILSPAALQKLEANFTFDLIDKTEDGHSVVRFTTAWSTQEADVQALVASLAAL